jgi:glutamate formiminotransferase/formiminotetrahydrofolate cyclodeaminase
MVDEDTRAFNRIMEAFALPKKSDEEKRLRDNSIQDATKTAILVPLKVMETAFQAFALIEEMVKRGNPNSVSDAGVGALALRSCVKGAFLNVKINASALNDKEFVNEVIRLGEEIESKAEASEEAILKMIDEKMKE